MADYLTALTLDQKIALLSGADFWRTNAVPEHGIPQVKLTDGPNGARGDLANAVPAACFPVGVALGATWNADLVREVGKALGEEVKSKNAHVLLAPTINLQRTPIGGRNFECFSEDPCLTGELAVAYVQGIQSGGVGACPKHFVGNDTEFERMTISSNIDERTLREVYLRPFERVVKDASPWMIMAAYNQINGIFACSHHELLIDILKEEWDFDGVVVSDWFAGRFTIDDANGGLDLEMPGPSRIWGDALRKAVDAGDVSPAEIDKKIIRLQRLIERAHPKAIEDHAPERGVDLPEHRALIRRAAAEAMVLLKNDDAILPLKTESIHSLAVIGPNAEVGQIMGGGSSFVNSHPPVHPLEGLRAAFPNVDIVHEVGCTNRKFVPVFLGGTVTTPDGESAGFLKEVFDGDAFAGNPRSVEVIPDSRMMFLDSVTGAGPSKATAIRIRGDFIPETSGQRILGLFSSGPARLRVNGDTVVDNWNDWTPGESFFGFGSSERRGCYQFKAGRRHEVVVEYLRHPETLVAGVQFGIDSPLPDDAIDCAAKAAASADAAILVLGSNADWESEGHDRADMALPGEQDALADAVLRVNPNTVIVMNVGAATSMPWFDKARSVLVCWFPGEEMGNALADVIVGATEPSGRLPFTWPKRIEDHPAYATYPGEHGIMPYTEGRLIGYRWYEKHDIEPLAPFGFGLGYGAVEIVTAKPAAGDQSADPRCVEVAVKNAANRCSVATVQIYAKSDRVVEDEPCSKLVGFAKAVVDADSQLDCLVSLDQRGLQSWSSDHSAWRRDEGVKLYAALCAAGPFVAVA